MKENRETTDTNVGDIEEAIERLEYIDRTYSCNNYYSIWDLKCIEIILSDYKRVLKENEELKADNYELNNRINDLLDNISVQKVKDKIRHYQELQDNYIKKYDEINEGLQAMINVLQELLEGRK